MPWRERPVLALRCGRLIPKWRSDLKWDRVPAASRPRLLGRTILDVGCGSGYHMWRMAGEGAELAIGCGSDSSFPLPV